MSNEVRSETSISSLRPAGEKAVLYRWLPALFYLVLVLSIPVLLVTVSVRLVMTPLFLQLEYQRPGFPADPYGFTTGDRLQYGVLGIEYLLNGEGIAFLADQRLPIEKCWNISDSNTAETCPLFNERELRHMVDVKRAVRLVFLLGVGFGAAALVSVLFLAPNARTRTWLVRGLLHGSTLTLALIPTIAIIAVTAWQRFFDIFHEILFEPGTWRFYYSDSLIRLYPEQFWFDAALVIGTMVTLGALLLWSLSWRYQRSNTVA